MVANQFLDLCDSGQYQSFVLNPAGLHFTEDKAKGPSITAVMVALLTAVTAFHSCIYTRRYTQEAAPVLSSTIDVATQTISPISADVGGEEVKTGSQDFEFVFSTNSKVCKLFQHLPLYTCMSLSFCTGT